MSLGQASKVPHIGHMTTDLIPTREVAARLGKSQRTIQRMVAREELTPAQIIPGRRGTFLFAPETGLEPTTAEVSA